MGDNRDSLLGSIKELEQLKDSRGEFIENLLAAFERDHPEFIEHLKECGLDEEEIRFCCLEVLGGVKIVLKREFNVIITNFMLNNPIYETILFLYYGLSWPCCHFLRDV